MQRKGPETWGRLFFMTPNKLYRHIFDLCHRRVGWILDIARIVGKNASSLGLRDLAPTLAAGFVLVGAALILLFEKLDEAQFTMAAAQFVFFLKLSLSSWSLSR